MWHARTPRRATEANGFKTQVIKNAARNGPRRRRRGDHASIYHTTAVMDEPARGNCIVHRGSKKVGPLISRCIVKASRSSPVDNSPSERASEGPPAADVFVPRNRNNCSVGGGPSFFVPVLDGCSLLPLASRTLVCCQPATTQRVRRWRLSCVHPFKCRPHPGVRSFPRSRNIIARTYT